MDTKQLFKECLDSATKTIMMVKSSDFDKPTPDTDWNVRDLVQHMIYELAWTADICEGKTISEVGNKYEGDLIGEDLLANWKRAADQALKAVGRANLTGRAHLSFGTFSIEYYLRQAANDQIIHSWDLSTALGEPISFNEKISEVLYQDALPHKDQLSKSGLFAPPVDVADDTDIQTKLLAIFGRDASIASKFRN